VRYKPASAIHCGKSLPSSTTVESQPQETVSGRRSRSGGYLPNIAYRFRRSVTPPCTPLPPIWAIAMSPCVGDLFGPSSTLRLPCSRVAMSKPTSLTFGPVIRKPHLPSGWRPLSLPLPARSARMRDSSRVTRYRGYDRHRRNRFQLWSGRSALLGPGLSRGERLAAK
jgi:hypothetical protein